jgi:hypothetical protein
MTLKINDTNVEGTTFLNMCNGAKLNPSCRNLGVIPAAYFVPKAGGDCISLVSELYIENQYDLLDETTPEAKANGFKVHKKNDSSFSVVFRCNPDKKTPEFTKTKENEIQIETYDACGHINEEARLLFSHKYVFSGILIFVGLIMLFVAGYKWDTVVGWIGFKIGFGAVFFVFWAFVNFTPELSSYLIILVVAIVVGLLLAFLFVSFIGVSYATLGFVSGLIISKYCVLVFQLITDQVI